MPDPLQSAGRDAEKKTSSTPVGQSIAPCPLQASWVEIALGFADGEPLAGEVYLVVDAMGHQTRGKLDAAGKARVLIAKGHANVSFPEVQLEPGAKAAPIAGAKGKLYTPGREETCAPESVNLFHTADWTLSKFEPIGAGAKP